MENPAQTDYPIEEVLRRRWSPKDFSSRPVENEKLLSLWEAARWAPSCFNGQPWHFLFASRNDQVNFEKILSSLVEKNQQWAKGAAVLMVSVARLNFEHNGKPNRHAFHDVGLAVGNMLVEATALGLVVHQMAGFSPDKIRELFAVPEGFEPVAAIAVGYPAEADESVPPRSRRPISSFVFEGTWGETASAILASN